MHSIIKSSFYILFLIISIVISSNMLTKSKGSKETKIFGFMVLFLGVGESFHLVPRILKIFSDDSVHYDSMLESGRFIASLFIVIVYLFLFWFCKLFYKQKVSKKIDFILLAIGVFSLILSVFFKDSNETILILLRNLPSMTIGAIVVFYLKRNAFDEVKKSLRYLWLAVALALVFTVGFELLSNTYSFYIILMMPKTLMNIWIVLMGYISYKKGLLQ